MKVLEILNFCPFKFFLARALAILVLLDKPLGVTRSVYLPHKVL